MENVIKRFAWFKTLNGFKSAEKGTDYDAKTIVLVKDKKQLWSHDTTFNFIPDGGTEGDVLVYNGTDFEWQPLSGIEIDGKELSEIIENLVTNEEFTSALEEYAKLTDIADYFDGAEYVSESKQIQFKHGETVKATIDATPFVKDGMVDNVEVKEGKLVITFNTEAGKEKIEIELTEIFNPNNYYDKSDVDSKLEDYYTKEEVDEAIEGVDVSDQLEDYVKKEDLTTTLSDYYKKDETYSKEEIEDLWDWYEGD